MNSLQLSTYRRFGEADLTHPGFVRAVGFSPDGRWIVTHSGEEHNSGHILHDSKGSRYIPAQSDVTLWERATFRKHLVFNGHAGVFAPDSATLFYLAKEKALGNVVRRMEVASGTILQQIALGIPLGNLVYCLALSPSGRLAAVGGYQRILVCDVEAGEVVGEFPAHPGGVVSLAFADERRVVSSGVRDIDTAFFVWDVDTGRQLATLPGTRVACRGFGVSPDGRLVIAGGAEIGSIRVWNTEDGAVVRELGFHNGYFIDAAFAPDGRHAATTAQDGNLFVWDVERGERVAALQPSGETGWLWDVAYDAENRCLAVAGPKGRIRLWSVPDYRELPLRKGGHEGRVHSVVIPDEDTILSSGAEGTIRCARLSTGEEWEWANLPDAPVTWLAYAPKQCWLASSHRDGIHRLWDVVRREVVQELPGHAPGYSLLTFSTDETHLLSADGNFLLRLWDVAEGRLEASLQVYDPVEFGDEVIHEIGLLPDPALVAESGIWNSPIRFWDWRQAKVVFELALEQGHGIMEFAISPDGRWLAAGSEHGRVALWEWPSRTLRHTWELGGYGVGALAWSADGTLLAASEQGTVTIWDVAAGKQVGQADIEAGFVFSLCFSPEGRYLVGGSNFGVIAVWFL